jgi:hypothetical protein
MLYEVCGKMSHTNVIHLVSQEASRKWLEAWFKAHAFVTGTITFDPFVKCAIPPVLDAADVDVGYWDNVSQQWRYDATVWAYSDHYEYRFFWGVPMGSALNLGAVFHPLKPVTPECLNSLVAPGTNYVVSIVATPKGWNNPIPASTLIAGAVLDHMDFLLTRAISLPS